MSAPLSDAAKTDILRNALADAIDVLDASVARDERSCGCDVDGQCLPCRRLDTYDVLADAWDRCFEADDSDVRCQHFAVAKPLERAACSKCGVLL